MIARLRRTGTSLVVTIPPHEAEVAGVEEGDLVEVEIRPAPKPDKRLRARFAASLTDLDARIDAAAVERAEAYTQHEMDEGRIQEHECNRVFAQYLMGLSSGEVNV